MSLQNNPKQLGKNSRQRRIDHFENIIGEEEGIKAQFKEAYNKIMRSYLVEGKTRIGKLAFDEEFSKHESKDLKSFYAGTPYYLSPRKLVSLSNKLSEEIIQEAHIHLDDQQIRHLEKDAYFQEYMSTYMRTHPEAETKLRDKAELIKELYAEMARKYFKNKISQNLVNNLPHIKQSLNFNMFFNTESILTPDELTRKVKEIHQEMINLFLQKCTEIKDMPPLEASILEDIRNGKIITSSGLNIAIQKQSNFHSKERKYYVDMFSNFADQAMLKLVKSEHAFHQYSTELEQKNDEVMIKDLRKAKKTAEIELRAIGKRLMELSTKYLPGRDITNLSTDFDSSLAPLNIFELISLLVQSKTLDDIHRYEIQLLGFMSHLIYAIQTDPHYQAVSNITFHMDRVDPDGRKFYITEDVDQSLHLVEKTADNTSQHGNTKYNLLHERTYYPKDGVPINYFHIGDREKRILSILIKLFVRSDIAQIGEITDLWGATFALNYTKEELENNPALAKSAFDYAKSIGEDNLYTDYDPNATQRVEKGKFSILKNKKGNANSSELFKPLMKIYSKNQDNVGQEVIIHHLDAFLKNLDKDSPLHHDFYDDFRLVQWSKGLFPSILLAEKQQHIADLGEAMYQSRKEYEEKAALDDAKGQNS